MDTIYHLPFPKDICSKIFFYTCKSPHTGLGVAILKKIIGLSIYNKLISELVVIDNVEFYDNLNDIFINLYEFMRECFR